MTQGENPHFHEVFTVPASEISRHTGRNPRHRTPQHLRCVRRAGSGWHSSARQPLPPGTSRVCSDRPGDHGPPGKDRAEGGTVSSAILFAAIIVIWIAVLVPRCLRHDPAHDGHLRLRRFSRQLVPDQQDGDANALAGFSLGEGPRYTTFGGHGDPREDQAKSGRADRDAAASGYSSLSQNYNAPHVSAAGNGNAGNGNTGVSAQPDETDEAPARVRSYGWSAEEYLRHEREYLRHERTSRRAPHDGRHPVERQEQSARAGRKPPQHDERRQHGGRRGSGRDHEEQRPGNRRRPRPRTGRRRTASSGPGWYEADAGCCGCSSP